MKRFTKKFSFISFLVLSLFLITACGSEESATEPEENTGNGAEEPAEAEAPAPAADGITFSMGHMNSTEHVQDSMAMRPFAEEVAEATEGRINFQLYPGGALGSPAETYDNIVTGIMDSGWGLQGYNAGVFEVHSVMLLPFLADGNGEKLSVITQKLYDTFPEIQAEYDNVKLLWAHAADPYAIITAGKQVTSLEDLRGLRLRTPSVEGGKMIESWGATPVSMPAPEIYDSMQRGVIDGGILPVAALADFNLFDVVDYVTVGNFSTGLFYTMMNKNSWDRISADDQAIIEEMIGEPMARTAGAAFDYQEEQARNKAEEEGIEFFELDEAELARFQEAAEVVTEEWLANMESKGIDGQAILDEALRLMEEN
ncbi:TRAP transporter solute receptor [Halalkalibacter wakoensis JCM 9140]|uniref:TRAP transporter solute receptor n=1 Tax=Halalkalibacter wakoensis JCM 9140 TaxID=1236970 RepID=W4Q5E3_9BACI|nr:TRAP transporter substrate-binding protein [Halalkalibacter wakoensis]GAE26574.1 TRAP transporter solute receptor [Halalkalibacter wakoensis JCM 9140]